MPSECYFDLNFLVRGLRRGAQAGVPVPLGNSGWRDVAFWGWQLYVAQSGCRAELKSLVYKLVIRNRYRGASRISVPNSKGAFSDGPRLD